ncbi:MAG: transporter [Halolamina sp.]|uniref:transporter n=1 Tax=Halolamina sp. TaxID=1940283 RepID=UPI002FC2C0E5
MSTVYTVLNSIHLLFAGLWTGATVFFAWRVRPLVADGDLAVEPTMLLSSGLRWLTRISAVVFVVTGGHMAATEYGDGALLSTTQGHIVVTMLVIWLVVTGLLEMALGTMETELGEGRVRTAGKEVRVPFLAASVLLSVVLLLGGYLSA